MARKQFSGTAIDTTLADPVTSGQMTIVTDDATGWPTTGPYVMALSYGTAGEEKILLSGRSSETHTVSQRGYDGTTASSHDNGAAVAHVLDAVTIDEANDHVNNDERDDHSQYLTTGRHDLAARHVFGDALGAPAAPEPVGTIASEGSGDAPAREDHTHRLATSSIDTSSLFVAGVVNAAALATDAVETAKIKDVNVTTGKIADYAITTAKLNTDAVTAIHIADGAIDNVAMFSGAKPVVIASAQPTGTTGLTYYDTDENRLFAYDGTAWRWIGGKPYAGQIRRTPPHPQHRSRTAHGKRSACTGHRSTTMPPPANTSRSNLGTRTGSVPPSPASTRSAPSSCGNKKQAATHSDAGSTRAAPTPAETHRQSSSPQDQRSTATTNRSAEQSTTSSTPTMLSVSS